MLKSVLITFFLSGCFLLRAQDFPADSIPPLNQKMLEFSTRAMGKKYGRGICAEFVSAAMNYTTGVPSWRPKKEVNPHQEWIRPGDVLYMSWYKRRRKMQSHVAVIIEVLEPHRVIVAHQNFNNQKFVVKTEYDLNLQLRRGRTVKIYRPVEKIQ